MANHIGIDIGTSAVKVVRVRSQFKRLRVEAISTVEVLAAGSVEAAVLQALSEVTGGKPQVHDGLAAAIAGVLSTRTDNDTGIITVASGHGITDFGFPSMFTVSAIGTPQ